MITLIFAAMLAWQPQANKPADKPDILAPYYPTPELVVQKMLEFGGLKPNETMWE